MERPGCSLLMATLAIGPRAVVRKDEEIDFMCCSNYLCLFVCVSLHLEHVMVLCSLLQCCWQQC